MAAIRDEWGEDSLLATLWASLGALAEERGLRISLEFVCDVVAEKLGAAAVCLVRSSGVGIDDLRYSNGDFGDRLIEIEVIVFPLAVGVVRAGVLAVYHTEPGAPATAKLREALVFADLVLALLLVELAGPAQPVPGPPGDGFPLVGPVHR
ncbi:hypothetical protein AB0M80_43600 [Amycolatopsis sp. NPDC051045]|uniref:hypothetical protein n=1 Tax=Amycolatopsis sp. NPDC051045 TaxID=3156922 RepID=UPI003426A06A